MTPSSQATAIQTVTSLFTNLPVGTSVTGVQTLTDPEHGPCLSVTLTGAKAQAIMIPLVAIKDRRSVYKLADCLNSPGSYCSLWTSACTSCQAALRKCVDEHVAAGRL